MKILYIISHPNTGKSFNHKIAKRATEMMKDEKHEVRCVDLHEIKFNPIGDANDFVKRRINDRLDYQREQEWASEDDSFVEEIKIQMENIRWSELIIFQFPLWWWGFPAMLKGYLDRVYCKGFVFGKKYELRGKKILLSVTTGGANSTDLQYESCFTNIYSVLNMLGGSIHKTFYFRNTNYATYEKKKELLGDFVEYLKNEVLVGKGIFMEQKKD